jgi:hypothetical protein
MVKPLDAQFSGSFPDRRNCRETMSASSIGQLDRIAGLLPHDLYNMPELLTFKLVDALL